MAFFRTSRLRRINPTPVGKMPTAFQANTSHFTSNILFDAALSTGHGSVASLQEERRLLVEERSRQGSKFGKKHAKSVKLTEISTTEGDNSSKDTGEHVGVAKEDVPLLSAVTSKELLDSIGQCYSSLLKGVPLLAIVFHNMLHFYFCRSTCS